METIAETPAQGTCDPEAAAAEAAFWRGQAEQQARLYEAQIELLKQEVDRLSEQVAVLAKGTYGRKSEKGAASAACEGQLALVFNDMEAVLDGAPEVAEDAWTDVEGHRRKRPKERRPKSTVREVLASGTLPEEVVDCDVDDRSCPRCGTEMREYKVTEKRVLELVPAQFRVTVYREHHYCCPECSAANAAGEDVPATFKKGSAPRMPLAKSPASPSLIAYVVNGKFVNSMPLARVERELSQVRDGLFLSRQDMANWVVGSWERWLSRVAAHMRSVLLSEPVVHMDETPVEVVRPDGAPAPKRGYMWVARSPEASARPVVLYNFRQGRSRADLLAALGGGYSGAIMSDCYRAYFGVDGVTNLACLVHVRRGFIRVVDGNGRGPLKAAGSIAQEGVDRLTTIMRADAAWKGLAPEERKAKRRAALAPLLDDFRDWAVGQRPKAMPRSLLANALDNAIVHWPHVENVLLDGRYPLDNNAAERAIRPFVVGRKNWLFCRTPRGAEASAGVYSVVETAKANGLNPRLYVQWLLEEMPNADDLGAGLDRLMPWSPEAQQRCRLKNKRQV